MVMRYLRGFGNSHASHRRGALGVGAVLLGLAGCGGKSDATAVNPQEAKASHVVGQFLARASVTSTHTVEFWEVRPGSVMMLQKLQTGAGDKSLDLGRMLLNAGGTYAGLYRKLQNDPNAPLSPELLAADEHRSQLPIRNGSLARPQASAPPHPSRTSGTAVLNPRKTSVAPPAQGGTLPAQPGALSTLSFDPNITGNCSWDPRIAQGSSQLTNCEDYYDNLGIILGPDPGEFDCSAPEVDGGWCPGGAYNNFIYGDSDETIFYDSSGFNPQSYPDDNGPENDDDYYVWEWTADEGWIQDVDWDLFPGETIRTTFIGAPANYEGGVNGNIVAFADRYRLSFPSFSYSYTAPYATDNLGSFSKDIEGLAHGDNHWFLSRTEFCSPSGVILGQCGSGDSLYGQVGISGNLGDPSNQCTFDEPSAWSGYTHFGDLVYEPALPPIRSGFLITSLNDVANHYAAVGFLGVVPNSSSACQEHYTLADWGTVPLCDPADEAAGTCSYYEQAPAVALTHKYSNVDPLNSAHIYVPSSLSWNALYEYVISYQTSPPQLVSLTRTPLVNTNSAPATIAPNGMKVSSTGKLYTWELVDQNTGRFYGIDPFDGMVQMYVDVPVQPGAGGDSLEAEGLDIINSGEYNYSRNSQAEILVQTLDNSRTSWAGQHYVPDDPSRL